MRAIRKIDFTHFNINLKLMYQPKGIFKIEEKKSTTYRSAFLDCYMRQSILIICCCTLLINKTPKGLHDAQHHWGNAVTMQTITLRYDKNHQIKDISHCAHLFVRTCPSMYQYSSEKKWFSISMKNWMNEQQRKDGKLFNKWLLCTLWVFTTLSMFSYISRVASSSFSFWVFVFPAQAW